MNDNIQQQVDEILAGISNEFKQLKNYEARFLGVVRSALQRSIGARATKKPRIVKPTDGKPNAGWREGVDLYAYDPDTGAKTERVQEVLDRIKNNTATQRINERVKKTYDGKKVKTIKRKSLVLDEAEKKRARNAHNAYTTLRKQVMKAGKSKIRAINRQANDFYYKESQARSQSQMRQNWRMRRCADFDKQLNRARSALKKQLDILDSTQNKKYKLVYDGAVPTAKALWRKSSAPGEAPYTRQVPGFANYFIASQWKIDKANHQLVLAPGVAPSTWGDPAVLKSLEEGGQREGGSYSPGYKVFTRTGRYYKEVIFAPMPKLKKKTVTMQPRPFLSRSLEAVKAQLPHLLTRLTK